MKLLIVQTSPCHTGSTLLINALYGLIPELSNKRIITKWNLWSVENFDEFFKNIVIIKDHDTNIDNLIEKYNHYKEVVFVCSERKEINALIDEKYKTYNNTIVFSFEELNETKNNSLLEIVDNIYMKVKTVLPEDIELDKTKCIERINNMNIRYEEIKDKHFHYVDPFFEIHGSHRNRKNQC